MIGVILVCTCLASSALACPEGLYGGNCSLPCNCRDNTTCNPVSGACKSGCSYGFAGLSCSFVLPTLPLPPTVLTGEECGMTEITWTHGEFRDLDSRISLHSYQIDYKKTSELSWSTKRGFIEHNDSVHEYSGAVSQLSVGAEYIFRVNIRVSEYGEFLPDYTLGPISDPINIQCKKFTVEATSSSARGTMLNTTKDISNTTTTVTPPNTRKTQNRTTTQNDTTQTASTSATTKIRRQTTATATTQLTAIATTQPPTTETTQLITTATERTITTSPLTTQSISRTTRLAVPITESVITRHSSLGTITTKISSKMITTESISTRPNENTTSVWSKLASENISSQRTTVTTPTTEELKLLNGELELMIRNLSVRLDPQLRSLLISWQLDVKYLYLMKSGALFFGMIGIGDCYVSSFIDWAFYPLSMYIRQIRIPVVKDWRIYTVRIEYYQYTTNGYIPYAELNFTTPKHEPTESVKNVTIGSITSMSANIKWIIPKCKHRGSDVIFYTCTLSEANTANKIKSDTQLTFIQIDRLKPFTNYSVVVTIKNDIGSGPSSSTTAFQTLEDVPGPPTIIKLTPLLNTAMVVLFAPPLDANGLIIKYRVSVEEKMTSYQIEIDSDVTSVTIKNLAPFTLYYVKVKARTRIGWGSFSSVRTVRTLEDLPGSPGNFSVIFQDETTIGLQWTSPNFTLGVIQGYKLFYRRGTDDSETVSMYGSHSTLSQVNVTNLDSGEYYHFRVQARSDAGYGPGINKTSFTLPARPAKPAVPTISYSRQQLTLKLPPDIIDEKHFYMVRVYADDVSLSEAKNPAEGNEPTGTVILIMDKTDITQNVIYILGDNSTRHGIHNPELQFNHSYVFYLEIVTRFENIIRSNFVKHPESFTMSLLSLPVDGSSADDKSASSLSGIVVGIVLGIVFIPTAALICIATKRSDKNTLTNATMTKSKYDANKETAFWPKNKNISRSNSMQKSNCSQSQALENDSYDVNTFSPIKLTNRNKNITRSKSFQKSRLKNDFLENTIRGNLQRSLSDTEMIQKNNIHRSSSQRAQTWHTLNATVKEGDRVGKTPNSNAPPKPPRHRLRRSNTGSRLEELKRRTCSPIPEEVAPAVTQISGVGLFCSKNELRPKYRPELNGSSDRDIEYNTHRLDASNFNVNDAETQTVTGGDVTRRKRIKRKRRILASKAMSDNRGSEVTADERRAKQFIDGISVTEYHAQKANQFENFSIKVNKTRKRKRSLKRKSDSMRENKTFEYGYSRRSLSFSEGPISQYEQSDIEMITSPETVDIKEEHGQMIGVTDVNTESTSFGMRRKSRSFRVTESSMRGEFRDQDVLKFWSKTYSFLDERKIMPKDEKFEEYKVTSFFESDRPQTVSLELEFKSLPTGVLGTTNTARQKAGVPSHKLCQEAYDHSRVLLEPVGPDDYINACYIKDRVKDRPPRYIVAQTPQDAVSATKFWRMVLQERTKVIVKLSQQPDIFPSVISRTSGLITERFQLSHSEDIPLHGCFVRYIKITNLLDHTSRGIYIVQDLMWPDDDRFYLPHDTKEFISLRNVVRKCSGTCSAPMIVHCSQEDGRSGVFISVDALLLEYEKQQEVNVFSFVRNMLKDRYGIIKTIWQYRFIYEALLEANSQN